LLHLAAARAEALATLRALLAPHELPTAIARERRMAATAILRIPLPNKPHHYERTPSPRRAGAAASPQHRVEQDVRVEEPRPDDLVPGAAAARRPVLIAPRPGRVVEPLRREDHREPPV